MANYTPKKVHPHKISLVFLCKSPLVWILGVAITPPKSIPPWKIRKPPPTSKDMPRCIAAITVMEAPPLEPRLVGVVEGMKFPMNGRMECRLALHVIHIIYPVWNLMKPSWFVLGDLESWNWVFKGLWLRRGKLRSDFAAFYCIAGWLTFLWLALILDPSPPAPTKRRNELALLGPWVTGFSTNFHTGCNLSGWSSCHSEIIKSNQRGSSPFATCILKRFGSASSSFVSIERFVVPVKFHRSNILPQD